MKTSIFAILLIFLALSTVYGTPQYPDKFHYDGEVIEFDPFILEPYFEKNTDKRPEGIGSTALLRGYVASYFITNNTICLKDIEVQEGYCRRDSKWTSKIDDLKSKEILFPISWYTGLIQLSHGEGKKNETVGFGYIHTKYTILEISDGLITKRKTLNHREYEIFLDQLYSEFKKTREYKNRLKQYQKVNYPPESAQNEMRYSSIYHVKKFPQ